MNSLVDLHFVALHKAFPEPALLDFPALWHGVANDGDSPSYSSNQGLKACLQFSLGASVVTLTLPGIAISVFK